MLANWYCVVVMQAKPHNATRVLKAGYGSSRPNLAATDTRWNRCPATWRRPVRCVVDASNPDSPHRIVKQSATVAISAIPQQCPTPWAKRLCRPQWWVCDLRTRSGHRPTCPNRPWTRGIRHAVRCTDICPGHKNTNALLSCNVFARGGNGEEGAGVATWTDANIPRRHRRQACRASKSDSRWRWWCWRCCSTDCSTVRQPRSPLCNCWSTTWRPSWQWDCVPATAT